VCANCIGWGFSAYKGVLKCSKVAFSPEPDGAIDEEIMQNTALAQPASDGYPKVASPMHTVVVLAVLGGWAFWHKVSADQLSVAANPNRVRYYLVTLLFEWLLFTLVVAGVRRSGKSVLIVLGDHWQSMRQVLRDIGIAFGFWIVAALLLWIFGLLLQIHANGRYVTSMLPRRGIELTFWIALSVTAGICEETIFRGYLQRQFMALTKSAPVGIFLSATTFGAAHAYQGFRMTILIALYGAMFGILAYWRGSVRPGMIAHALQDSLNGVLANVIKP
jgi:membrane protease YdiL (CAAX protease family)